MERLSHRSEIESTPEIGFSQPVTDILKDPVATAELWPDQAEQLVPQVERRQQIASAVNQYLDEFCSPEPMNPEIRQNYWRATSELLRNKDYERIALFLPFESLPGPEDTSMEAEQFREDYLEAWENLLCVQDVRANFNDGDVLEVDARPGDPERVVKAAHLAPFLIQRQMIATEDVLMIMESGADAQICRGFLDTLPLMQDLGQVSAEEQARFEAISESLPPLPESLEPKYISKARKAWLAEKAKPVERPVEFTRDFIKLGLPLASRIENLQAEITAAEQLAANLDPEKTTGVVLLGGSRLKGYGRPESDLDLYVVTNNPEVQVEGANSIAIQEFYEHPSSYAHEMFDTLMLGEPEKIQALQRELAPIYFQEKDQSMREWNTERLEQDLLEYRLLQKGYARLCPDTNPEYKKYVQMDGQSTFYETGFRMVATKIYANSIFIPKVVERAEED